MFRIRKKFKFEAAHKLESSESKECQVIHGHSYKVEVFLLRLDLNQDGMVEDFKIVKEVFQPVIDQLDHSLILKEWTDITKALPKKTVVLGFNPTAENIAKYIYDAANLEALSDEVIVTSIRVHETDSGYAEYFPQDKEVRLFESTN